MSLFPTFLPPRPLTVELLEERCRAELGLAPEIRPWQALPRDRRMIADRKKALIFALCYASVWRLRVRALLRDTALDRISEIVLWGAGAGCAGVALAELMRERGMAERIRRVTVYEENSWLYPMAMDNMRHAFPEAYVHGEQAALPAENVWPTVSGYTGTTDGVPLHLLGDALCRPGIRVERIARMIAGGSEHKIIAFLSALNDSSQRGAELISLFPDRKLQVDILARRLGFLTPELSVSCRGLLADCRGLADSALTQYMPPDMPQIKESSAPDYPAGALAAYAGLPRCAVAIGKLFRDTAPGTIVLLRPAAGLVSPDMVILRDGMMPLVIRLLTSCDAPPAVVRDLSEASGAIARMMTARCGYRHLYTRVGMAAVCCGVQKKEYSQLVNYGVAVIDMEELFEPGRPSSLLVASPDMNAAGLAPYLSPPYHNSRDITPDSPVAGFAGKIAHAASDADRRVLVKVRGLADIPALRAALRHTEVEFAPQAVIIATESELERYLSWRPKISFSPRLREVTAAAEPGAVYNTASNPFLSTFDSIFEAESSEILHTAPPQGGSMPACFAEGLRDASELLAKGMRDFMLSPDCGDAVRVCLLPDRLAPDRVAGEMLRQMEICGLQPAQTAVLGYDVPLLRAMHNALERSRQILRGSSRPNSTLPLSRATVNARRRLNPSYSPPQSLRQPEIVCPDIPLRTMFLSAGEIARLSRGRARPGHDELRALTSARIREFDVASLTGAMTFAHADHFRCLSSPDVAIVADTATLQPDTLLRAASRATQRLLILLRGSGPVADMLGRYSGVSSPVPESMM